MESDSWTRFTAATKHHQSRCDDLYLGSQEMELDFGGDEDSRAEYPCPFCNEDFDVVGLCCHIDGEHPVDAKIGVCPVCQVRFGADMVPHLIVEHGNFFKMQRKKRFRKGPSWTHSAISFSKKELREGNAQSFLGGSFYTVAPSNPAPDPLLSSFINLSVADSSKDGQTERLDERSTIKVSDKKVLESIEPSLSDKDHEERARRSKFVHELLLSTIFDDTL